MTFHLTDLETPVPLAEIHEDFSATFFWGFRGLRVCEVFGELF
jgi:hypothetical protein